MKDDYDYKVPMFEDMYKYKVTFACEPVKTMILEAPSYSQMVIQLLAKVPGAFVTSVKLRGRKGKWGECGRIGV